MYSLIHVSSAFWSSLITIFGAFFFIITDLYSRPLYVISIYLLSSHFTRPSLPELIHSLCCLNCLFFFLVLILLIHMSKAVVLPFCTESFTFSEKHHNRDLLWTGVDSVLLLELAVKVVESDLLKGVLPKAWLHNGTEELLRSNQALVDSRSSPRFCFLWAVIFIPPDFPSLNYIFDYNCQRDEGFPAETVFSELQWSDQIL